MSSGLARDALVILRMDGDDLLEFVKGPSYEHDMLSIFSHIDMSGASFSDNTIKVLQLLSVDHGMPPLSDPWVMSNIVEPALKSFVNHHEEHPVTEEIMLEEFKKVAETLAQLLKEQPVIVAHNEQTFDGSGIRRLLSSKFELNKALEIAMKDLQKDEDGKVSKDHIHAVLDLVGPSAGLPPLGTVHQMDAVVKEAVETKMVAGEGNMIVKDEFKKLVNEVLESIMVRLQEHPVLVWSNTVVHEPLSSSSAPVASSS